MDVVRDENDKKIIGYKLTDLGYLDFDQAFKLVCHGEVDNARPVFPNNGRLYIRTKKDKKYYNNIEHMGA